MPVQGNENLAILLEPDADEIVEELYERLKRGIFYANCGDCVISLNPQSARSKQDNSPENGKRYCSKRFIPNLPAHVYSLVHKVYYDVISTLPRSEAHSILVSGIAGSGKTEISEMMTAQFLREAGVSQWDDIPFFLMKGLFALKRLLTCRSASGPTSSTASMVVTLYFGQRGSLKTAKVALHLLNPRHTVPHAQDRGYLNIFYDLVAALQSGSPGLSTKEKSHIILQALDPALTRMNHETMADHRNNWMDFVEIIRDLGIGENVHLDRQGDANSFLDALLGFLLLATTQFDMNQQTKQFRLRSEESFATAAQLLGVSDRALYDAIVPRVSTNDNLPPINVVQSRDQLVHELYSRLVLWLIEEINGKLPDVENGDVPVHIADLPPYLDNSSGSLEDLCHNMAAEYVQMLQNQAVFVRDNDASKAEGLKVSAIKKQRCDNIVDMAFTTPGGLLHQLETSLTLPDKALIKSLDTNFKKRKDLYIGSKTLGSVTFAVAHSHKQVQYHIDLMFRYQNLIIPNRVAQKLLAASRNVTVRGAFKPVIMELSGPDIKSHFSYMTSVRVQVNALKDHVFGAVPHLVRCIKPLTVGSQFDASFLKDQVRSAYLPDICHNKKFGYSHWMTIPDFLRRYQMLELSLLTHAVQPEEACKLVLKRVGILEKGPAITKRCVFLGYWHKEELDTFASSFVWKITLVQAIIRGHLARKRVHEIITARLRAYDEAASFRRGESSSRVSRDQIQHDEVEENELFERMISKTLYRVSNTSSGAWCKVIYMEQDKEIAKAYATELSLLVTGSREPFDGLELGLSHFQTSYRSAETEHIVRTIGQGIELRRDSDGSLLVNRYCQLPVSVKFRQSQPVLSADVIRTRGELPRGHFTKIFDMQEFYSLISLQMRKPNFSKTNLQRSCITVLRFGSSYPQILKMPCWIAVININALNVLNDIQELESISLMTSQLTLIKDKDDGTKEEQEEAKMRRQRKHWSKSDQRPQLKKREANSRKIREELRNRGERISDHMKYSWEEGVGRKAGAISMDQLYEKMRRQSSDTASASSQGSETAVKNWAKVNVTLREAFRELQRAEVEETIIKERESL